MFVWWAVKWHEVVFKKSTWKTQTQWIAKVEGDHWEKNDVRQPILKCWHHIGQKRLHSIRFWTWEKMFKILDWLKIELIDSGEPKGAIS